MSLFAVVSHSKVHREGWWNLGKIPHVYNCRFDDKGTLVLKTFFTWRIDNKIIEWKWDKCPLLWFLVSSRLTRYSWAKDFWNKYFLSLPLILFRWTRSGMFKKYIMSFSISLNFWWTVKNCKHFKTLRVNRE